MTQSLAIPSSTGVGDCEGRRWIDRLPAPSIASRVLHDGSLLLRSNLPVAEPPRSIVALADTAAERFTERDFLRERDADGDWTALSFLEFRERSTALAQWLLDQGLQPGDTVAVLASGGLDHANFAMGAMRIRVTVASLNPRFGLVDSHKRLQHCLSLLRPKLILAADPEEVMASLEILGAAIPVVGIGSRKGSAGSIAGAASTIAGSDVGVLQKAISPDDVARIVFTSGSSGAPKAVPQTQRMLAAQVSQAESMGLLNFTSDHPKLVDGLPWHHIFGSNYNFNTALRAGVTITLDDGLPTVDHFAATLANLREVAPSHIATVPLAITLLCDALEQDRALRERLLANLDYILFGGAGLNAGVVARLHRLAVETTARPIPVLGTYGSTEMQLTAAVHFPTMRADLMGVPVPGLDFKLTPVGGKTEVRVRGPSVMPRSGYIDNGSATEAAFDEEGFYRTGDAAILAESDDPSGGLIFDGRLAEEFKLASGTWVSAGMVRAQVLTATTPLLLDCVVCGLNRDELGLLAWANPNAAGSSTDPEMLRSLLEERLWSHNRQWSGLSMRIGRLMIMREPLDHKREEITDKGTVNLSRVWKTREADIDRLFISADSGNDVLVFPVDA